MDYSTRSQATETVKYEQSDDDLKNLPNDKLPLCKSSRSSTPATMIVDEHKYTAHSHCNNTTKILELDHRNLVSNGEVEPHDLEEYQAYISDDHAKNLHNPYGRRDEFAHTGNCTSFKKIRL